MTNNSERRLTVKWSFCNLSDATDLTGGDDYGLYQVHGYHPVYGRDSPCLLYVGEAVWQTFSARLAQHLKHWLSAESELHPEMFSVRVGRISGHLDPKGPPESRWLDWGNCVSHAEKLTIWFNTPAYNSKNIARPPNITLADVVTVENEGDTGNLLVTYSWPPASLPPYRGDDV